VTVFGGDGLHGPILDASLINHMSLEFRLLRVDCWPGCFDMGEHGFLVSSKDADVIHLEEDAWQLCEDLVHSCTESVGGLLSGL